MEVFNFTPKGDVKRNVHYLDRTIEYESGSFQVQRVGVNPLVTFSCDFEGNGDSLKELEEFYLQHRKSEKFKFNYDNKEYICQFTSDYSPTDTWGWDERGRIIGKVTVTLEMRVVYLEDITS